MPLWWALALGACLGGNGTIIGASANVVIVDIARKAGHPISFWQFFKFGFPVMVGSVFISALYLWLLFLR
jgi:Na+/H+ antiporter NhaD/arsenite permease-like protein